MDETAQKMIPGTKRVDDYTLVPVHVTVVQTLRVQCGVRMALPLLSPPPLELPLLMLPVLPLLLLSYSSLLSSSTRTCSEV